MRWGARNVRVLSGTREFGSTKHTGGRRILGNGPAHTSVTRLFTRLPRLTLVVVLLALTLAVAAALAWQAHQAARSHEAVAAKVQQDYVDFAGWQFSRAARQELTSRLDRWLRVIACSVTDGRLPRPDQLDSGPGCKCDDLVPRSLFSVDLRTGAIEVTGEPLGPEASAWISGVRRGEPRMPATGHGHVLSVGRTDGLPLVMALTYARDRYETPTSIAGFTADPMALAPAFTHIVEHSPLLPPTLAGKSNDLLRVAITARDGSPIFGVEAPDAWIRTQSAFDGTLDHLQYQIALRPEQASRLVIGGLPRSRVPLLLGLLGLTAGLLAVAIQQLRREHELTRLRGDFVASVSHELRTPLAQIRLFSETLLLGRIRSEAEGRRSLEIIQQESRRLAHLVENVLYFSRGERGASRLSLVPTDLAALAAELIEAFAPLARSGRSTIDLHVRAGVVVPADSGALRQILLNLLDNAVKYGGPERVITVGIDRRDDKAVITVDDQGTGVPADARQRIWEPYSRLAPAAASAVAGTGIGLAVVRDLVTQHGGSVRVEDAPGGGARFVVELPDAQPAAAPGDAAAAAHSQVPA
jgi:signal transduction histidine kinase